MSGTGRTRRLGNWERERRGDAPRAPRRRSHRRGRMALSQVPAAPRAREGMNVSSERVSSYKNPVSFHLTVYPYAVSRTWRNECGCQQCAMRGFEDERRQVYFPHVAARATLCDGWRGASRRVPLPLHQLRAANPRGRVRRVRATTFFHRERRRVPGKRTRKKQPLTLRLASPSRFRTSQARRVAQGRG